MYFHVGRGTCFPLVRSLGSVYRFTARRLSRPVSEAEVVAQGKGDR